MSEVLAMNSAQEQGIRESILRSRPVILATTALAAAGVMMGSERAEAASVVEAPVVTEMTTTNRVLIGSSHESVQSAAKAQIVANHRTVSKATVKKAERNGKCEFFTGKEAIKEGLQTQGYMSTGVGFAQENRPTTACDTNNDGKFDTRADCGNALIDLPPKPKKAKNTVWVNNRNVAKIVVKSKSVATAKAGCEITSDDGRSVVTASASGRGVGYGRAGMRIRSALRSKSNGVYKLSSKSHSEGYAVARSSAKADAVATCEQKSGEVTPPNPPTPPTPPENLPPSVVTDTPNHVRAGSRIVFCAIGADQDGFIKSYTFNTNRGFFVAGSRQPGNDVGEVCETYQAPSAPDQDATLSVQVADNQGKTAEDSTTFPIVDIAQ